MSTNVRIASLGRPIVGHCVEDGGYSEPAAESKGGNHFMAVGSVHVCRKTLRSFVRGLGSSERQNHCKSQVHSFRYEGKVLGASYSNGGVSPGCAFEGRRADAV